MLGQAMPALLPEDMIDLLTALVDKSLVHFEPTTQGYALTESVRVYGLERLRAEHERDAMQEAHCAYYTQFAHTVQDGLEGPDAALWLRRMNHEADNIRAALDWAASSPAGGLRGLELASGMWRYWELRGMLTEGYQRLTQALAHPTAQAATEVRADAENGAGNLAMVMGEYDAVERHFRASLAIRSEQGSVSAIAASRNNLANLDLVRGQYESAKEGYETAIRLWESIGNDDDIGSAVGNLGGVHRMMGNNAACVEHCRRAIEGLRRHGNETMMHHSLYWIVLCQIDARDFDGAKETLREALAICRKLVYRPKTCHILDGLALMAAIDERWSHAATLRGASDHLRMQFDVTLHDVEEVLLRDLLALAGPRVDSPEWSGALAAGAAMSWEQAVQIGFESLDQLPDSS